MNNPQTEVNKQKQITTAEKADYRGFEILETADGCCLFLYGRQYDFIDLDEATAFIDALYANAARRVTM